MSNTIRAQAATAESNATCSNILYLLFFFFIVDFCSKDIKI